MASANFFLRTACALGFAALAAPAFSGQATPVPTPPADASRAKTAFSPRPTPQAVQTSAAQTPVAQRDRSRASESRKARKSKWAPGYRDPWVSVTSTAQVSESRRKEWEAARKKKGVYIIRNGKVEHHEAKD